MVLPVGSGSGWRNGPQLREGGVGIAGRVRCGVQAGTKTVGEDSRPFFQLGVGVLRRAPERGQRDGAASGRRRVQPWVARPVAPWSWSVRRGAGSRRCPAPSGDVRVLLLKRDRNLIVAHGIPPWPCAPAVGGTGLGHVLLVAVCDVPRGSGDRPVWTCRKPVLRRQRERRGGVGLDAGGAGGEASEVPRLLAVERA